MKSFTLTSSQQVAAAAVLGMLLLIPSLGMYYVSEDVTFIHFLTGDTIWSNLRHIFASPSSFTDEGGGLYRPVTLFFNLLDYSIWGLNPFGYHLTNGLFHAANTVLVYLLCCGLFRRDRSLALLATLFFAVHPIHANSVYWISGRTDVIAAFFYPLSLLILLAYLKSGRSCYLISIAVSGLLALLSKEMAVTLPLVHIWTVAFFTRDREVGPYSRKSMMVKVIIADVLAIGLFLLIRSQLFIHPLDVGNIYRIHDPIHYVTNVAKAAAFLIIPFGHATFEQYFYSHKIPLLIAGATILLLLIVSQRQQLKKHRALLWLGLLLVLISLPLVRLTMRWYMYLPSFPFSMMLAYVLTQTLRQRQKIVTCLLIGYLGLHCVGLAQQTYIWQSNSRMNRKLVQSLLPYVEKHRGKQILIAAFPIKIHRTATFVGGFEDLISLLAHQPPQQISRLIYSAHRGSYRHCRFEWSGNGFLLKAGDKTSYFEIYDARYFLGLKQWQVGELVAADQGNILVLGVNSYGFINSLRFDFYPEVLATEPVILFFDGNRYAEVAF